MHRFHQSRGRILFEVACALTISASCVGAWMQTYASAFLPAAAAAALYGLVHAFDLARPKPRLAADPPTDEIAAAPLDEQPQTVTDLGLAEAAEPATVQKTKSPRKPARKGGRRTKAATPAAIVDAPQPVEQAAAVDPVEVQAAAVDPVEDNIPVDTEEDPPPEPFEENAPIPIAPLFEPEPFVRQQRTVFGRKAG